jgi:hypothetical protein
MRTLPILVVKVHKAVGLRAEREGQATTSAAWSKACHEAHLPVMRSPDAWLLLALVSTFAEWGPTGYCPLRQQQANRLREHSRLLDLVRRFGAGIIGYTVRLLMTG